MNEEEDIDYWDLPEEQRGSEFGAGIVICLAKFSEHLWNWQAESAMAAMRWDEMTDEERQKIRNEMQIHPHGDAARRYSSIVVTDEIWKDRGHTSHSLELWANGASDHFYDLDRERSPKSLVELADLTLTMGHGFTGRVWTREDWQHIHELWREACIEIDLQLGIENPDWGCN